MKKFLLASSALLLVTANAASAQEKTLTISVYGFAQDAFKELVYTPFEQKCGCKLVVETGNSVERLAKMEANKASPVVDMAVVSMADALSATRADLIEKIDTSKLQNFNKLYDLAKDPNGDGMSVGYTFYATSIVYRSDKMEVNSWADLLSEKNASHVAFPNVTTNQGPPALYMVGEAIGKNTPDLKEAIAAAELLAKDFGVTADIWSATSFNELARDGQDAARWNRLNPLEAPRVPYVTQALSGAKGPFIAATDYMKNYAEQIRAFVPGRYTVLGTDGFGRSDSRVNLRRFFEVDANHIAAAAMVCCASTSSGLAGTCRASICPARMRSTTTADWTRSPRNFGMTTPRLTAPTWWPARPTRCSPEATDGGDSIWMTRSIAPMSMPSSRLLVATTHGSRPDFRASSISARWSLLTDPWCARARTAATGSRASVSASGSGAVRSAQISLSRVVRRSASRRELTKTRVERCCATRSTIRSSTCGQIDARGSSPAAAPDRSPVVSPRSARSGTGTTTSRSHSFVDGGRIVSTGRPPAR